MDFEMKVFAAFLILILTAFTLAIFGMAVINNEKNKNREVNQNQLEKSSSKTNTYEYTITSE